MGLTDPSASDLQVLRLIRKANPDSKLRSLWFEGNDPYTNWEGVVWVNKRVYTIIIPDIGLECLPNVHLLTEMKGLNVASNRLAGLNVAGLSKLQTLICQYNNIQTLNMSNLSSLTILKLSHNQLSYLPSLKSKGLITLAELGYNILVPTEIDRLKTLQFTDAQLLPQDI